jgi:lysozyme
MSLREDLIQDEGVKLKPYFCPAGKLTLGVGRNIEDVGISEAEAMAMLDNDIIRVTHQIEKELPWARSCSASIRRALGNLTFQVGIGGLLKFKRMLAAIQAGDYNTAADEALDSEWAKQTPERAARVAALIRSGSDKL